MGWLAIIWLLSFAVFVEMVARAPVLEGDA
jgi:hypothetical protein